MNIGTSLAMPPYKPLSVLATQVQSSQSWEELAGQTEEISASEPSRQGVAARSAYTATLVNPETASALFALTRQVEDQQGVPSERDAHLSEEREDIIANFAQSMRENVTRSPRIAELDAGNLMENTGNISTDSNQLTFDDIARKYDVTNISPEEIDRLAAELQMNDAAPLRNLMTLMAHGREFLSHTPGNYYSEARLTEKMDLLTHVKEEREKTRGPKESWDEQIALLERLRASAEHEGGEKRA